VMRKHGFEPHFVGDAARAASRRSLRDGGA
jgi:hypothetical protein